MSRSSLRTRLLAVPTAVLAAAAFGPAAAQAITPSGTLATDVSNAADYAAGLQDTNGHFISGGLSNEWAFSGLAAAGRAAADILPPPAHTDRTKNARRIYRDDLSQSTWPSASPVVTDYERATLNAYSAGIDPARISESRNLIADIAGYWQTASPGYWGPVGNFNGTVFGLLALSAAKTTSLTQRVPQTLLDKSIQTVRNNQHNDGGWDWTQAEGRPSVKAQTSDIDMTGAAMASLCQAGVANTDSAVVAAKNFLRANYDGSTGGFSSSFGANADSNGWAISGLNACGFANQGTDFQGPSPSYTTPVDYLVGLQQAGGGFKYNAAASGVNAYASLDALRGLAGGAFSATPPTPTTAGEPQFVGSTAMVSGTTSKFALVVDDGSGTLKVCAVPVTASGTSTTLATVLTAAISSSTPSSCVTGYSPASGTITTLNGVTNAGARTWKVSVDGGTAAGATTAKTIGVGDTISLKYG
jgi:hypothetical protein